MNATARPGFVWVQLSRRNIEALLYMLDNRDKARPALESRTAEGIEILVEAEEDEVHYAGRDYPFGRMSWEDDERE